jgi:hypothetical protein
MRGLILWVLRQQHLELIPVDHLVLLNVGHLLLAHGAGGPYTLMHPHHVPASITWIQSMLWKQ